MVNIDKLTHAIEDAVAQGRFPTAEVPLFHYHTEDLYGRRVILPAGSVLTSKVHKFDHITIVLRGHATVVDEQGHTVEFRAPHMFVTKAGTQRVLLIHEDLDIATVHHCTEQDDDKVLGVIGCDTMEEYQATKLLENVL